MSRLIVFDVDSTLLRVESLDFAVEHALSMTPDGAARAAELSRITKAGMAGDIDFRQSLDSRIALAGLNRDGVRAAAQALAAELTPGMEELLARLRTRGRHVCAVSGGFMDLIWPALKALEFDISDIRANRFEFTGDVVTGFDRENPLSRNGGKAVVVAALKVQTGAELAIMVGDGMTDLEAFTGGAADAFIGFGGVTHRPSVARAAPVYTMSVEELGQRLLG